MKKKKPQLPIDELPKPPKKPSMPKKWFQFGEDGPVERCQCIAVTHTRGETMRIKPQGYKRFVIVELVKVLQPDGDAGEQVGKEEVFMVKMSVST